MNVEITEIAPDGPVIEEAAYSYAEAMELNGQSLDPVVFLLTYLGGDQSMEFAIHKS